MTTFASLADNARSADRIDTLLADGHLRSCAFAMGCFWAPDARFGAMDGVVRTRVGYAGGTRARPTYRALGDHAEVVRIDFDPGAVSFETLFEQFRQWYRPRPRFRGQYRPAVFARTPAQAQLAQAWVSSLADPELAPQLAIGRGVRDDDVARFWDAEDYHQKHGLRRHDLAVAALEAEFGERWDASELATHLNGLTQEELDCIDFREV